MAKLHQGSCLCGQVKYECIGEATSFYLCHCTRCQKGTGSAHAANIFVKTSSFTWLQGERAVKTYQHLDTLHVKSFCSECGSALPIVTENTDIVVLPAGSLDSQFSGSPNANIFVTKRASWLKDVNLLASYDELPDEPKR